MYVFIAKNCQKVAEQKLDSGEKIKLITVEFEKFLDIVYSDKLWCGPLAYDLFKIKGDTKKINAFKQKLF